MWLQVFSDHRVNGHQAEDTSFSHAALRVVVALVNQIKRVTKTCKTILWDCARVCVRVCHLYEPRHDLGQQVDQAISGNPLHHFALHLDGRQVDGVVGRLDDGTQHLDALVWADGLGQHCRRLLRRSHHLRGRGSEQMASEPPAKHVAVACNIGTDRWSFKVLQGFKMQMIGQLQPRKCFNLLSRNSVATLLFIFN